VASIDGVARGVCSDQSGAGDENIHCLPPEIGEAYIRLES
jgi:hypothetical protein